MQKEGMGCMMGGKDMPMMKMMQEMHGKMMGGGMATQPKGDTGPSSQAFNGVIAKMNAEMALPFSGNADVDFVKRMISHDQGAVDMAKVALAFGKDVEVKLLTANAVQVVADTGDFIDGATDSSFSVQYTDMVYRCGATGAWDIR